MKVLNNVKVNLVLITITFVVAMFVFNNKINTNKIEQLQPIIQQSVELKHLVENSTNCSIRLTKGKRINFISFCYSSHFAKPKITTGNFEVSSFGEVFNRDGYIDFWI